MWRNKYLLAILLCMVILILPGCKSSKRSHKDNPVAEETIIHGKIEKEPSVREKVAVEAQTWLGTPYAYGGSDKGRKTDCSGLVMVVYEQIANVKMPRNSAKQAEFCITLKETEVEPGDLVFFATGKDRNQISHVGVMIDAKRFVHASSSKGVILSDMNTPYYIRNFKKYGRVPLGSAAMK
ncbi:MAG: C40 family peptidase [Muribaculaceae bacterium]|nr:C40 family peptidase [Muribaculaceae bacterium]